LERRDGGLRHARSRRGVRVDIFAHVWHPPTWQYIEPLKDAQADALRIDKNLTSPRRLQAERGHDWRTIAKEIVADRVALIETALEAAADLNSRYPEALIDWRELVSTGAKAMTSSGNLTEKEEGIGNE
jgi:capsid protein